jgi:[ribosomal protein S18]-alanine N-acetyltransferase
MSTPDLVDRPAGVPLAPRLRPMRFADLPRVMEIEQESYAVPWSEATFRTLLRRRDADLVVVEIDGEIAGYTASWFVVDQSELGNVAVTAEWRGRGVGATLVENALRRAVRQGTREVFLEVRPSNTSARRLYERFGFQQVGRRSGYYTAPVEDALVMRRMLVRGDEGVET